jgi:antitoxin HicB
MRTNWCYAVTIKREGPDEYHAYSEPFPEAIASGKTEQEALAEMGQAIKAAVRGRMKDGTDIPTPELPLIATKMRTHSVTLSGALAAKASVYTAWKESKLTKVALAERMGRTESEIRRILDPNHGTKLAQLDEAASVLGGRLLVTFERAA